MAIYFQSIFVTADRKQNVFSGKLQDHYSEFLFDCNNSKKVGNNQNIYQIKRFVYYQETFFKRPVKENKFSHDQYMQLVDQQNCMDQA